MESGKEKRERGKWEVEGGRKEEANVLGRVVALVDDLLFISKMLETAKHVGVELKTAANTDALIDLIAQQKPALVIVDLNARQGGVAALERLQAAGHALPTVAFLSHVQTELAESARAAGCTNVMPRSKFTQNLAEILRGAASAQKT
jgi:DNA-binding NarL/FixJ family response regulator